MWIRTQNKNKLMNVEEFYVADSTNIHNKFTISTTSSYGEGFFLAEYPTYERCIEVLDEIEKTILNSNLSRNEGIARNVIPQVVVYQMPKE